MTKSITKERAFDAFAAQYIASAALMLVIGHEGLTKMIAEGQCRIQATDVTFDKIAGAVAMGVLSTTGPGVPLGEKAIEMIAKTLEAGFVHHSKRGMTDEIGVSTHSLAEMLLGVFNETTADLFPPATIQQPTTPTHH